MPRRQTSLVPLRHVDGMIASVADSLVSHDEGFRRLWSYIPFPALIPFHASRKKTKAPMGANRCGKTFAVIVELVSVWTGIKPPGLMYRFPTEDLSRDDWKKATKDLEFAEWKINKWLSERSDWPLLFPYDKYNFDRPRIVVIIVRTLEKDWPAVGKRYLDMPGMCILPAEWSGNYDDIARTYTGPDSGSLSVLPCGTSERATFGRGFQADYIMIDESSTRYAYTESLMRTIDRGGTISLPFCGQDMKMWAEDLIWKPCFGDDGLPIDPQPEHLYVQRLTIYDNPTLPPEEVRLAVMSMKPSERVFREMGYFAREEGNAAFHLDVLQTMLAGKQPGHKRRVIVEEVDVENGVWKGHMEQALKQRDPGEALWTVWEDPIPGHKYVIVSDASEGFERGDWQVADIWDMTRDELMKAEDRKKMPPAERRKVAYGWKQVAQVRAKLNPVDLFTDECCVMGTLYGLCLFAPETNTRAGGIVIQRARYYGNLYRRRDMEAVNERMAPRYGWHTDRWNKPILISTMNTMLGIWRDTGNLPIRSGLTLTELMAYAEYTERNDKGEYMTVFKAPQGEHDDSVITAMIAAYIGFYDILSLTSMQEPVNCAENGTELCGFPHTRAAGRGPFRQWRHGRKNLRQLRAASKRERFRRISSGPSGIDSPGTTTSTGEKSSTS